MKRIVRGSYYALQAEDEALAEAFGYPSRMDSGNQSDSLVASAIIASAKRYPEVFADAVAHAQPVERMRAAARRMGVPFPCLMYGVRPDIAEEVRPFDTGTLLLSLALADMEQHVFDELRIATNHEPLLVPPNLINSYLSADMSQAFRSICSSATGVRIAYPLLQIGVTAAELGILGSTKGEDTLITAMVYGADALYAVRAMNLGMTDPMLIAENSKNGIALEYALLT